MVRCGMSMLITVMCAMSIEIHQKVGFYHIPPPPPHSLAIDYCPEVSICVFFLFFARVISPIELFSAV